MRREVYKGQARIHALMECGRIWNQEGFIIANLGTALMYLSLWLGFNTGLFGLSMWFLGFGMMRFSTRFGKKADILLDKAKERINNA